METTMWTTDKLWRYDHPRVWHIASPIDHDDATYHALEHGNISSLTWEEKFGLKRLLIRNPPYARARARE